MYIRSAVLIFDIPYAMSLKDKRQVARSLMERTRRRFNVSVAEVDTQDAHKTLTVGIALVSGDADHAHRSLNTIIDFMETATDAILCSVETA